MLDAIPSVPRIAIRSAAFECAQKFRCILPNVRLPEPELGHFPWYGHSEARGLGGSNKRALFFSRSLPLWAHTNGQPTSSISIIQTCLLHFLHSHSADGQESRNVQHLFFLSLHNCSCPIRHFWSRFRPVCWYMAFHSLRSDHARPMCASWTPNTTASILSAKGSRLATSPKKKRFQKSSLSV